MKNPLAHITLFAFALSLIAFSCKAQNLVPNPSFENFAECPDTSSLGISAANNWYNPTGYSPDYYNACVPDTVYCGGVDVPKNCSGYQAPVTGVAYAGIITMYVGTSSWREYIQAALLDTLIAGKKYFVKFYVSVADSSPYAANNIGAYFSATPVSSSTLFYLPYSPQVSNNPITNPLNDVTIWTEVSDTFIAQGGEKYITIGNFNDDASTDTTYLKPSTWIGYSYHYIDDISVTCLDCSTGINHNDYDNVIKIFPNPASDFIYIEFRGFLVSKVTLLNAMGQVIQVIHNEKPRNNNSVIPVSRFRRGIYFLKIESENSSTTKRIFINP